MKTLLLTDLHGKDPSRLIRGVAEKEGIEALAVLGDLDTPEVLQWIQESVNQYNLRFVYTPGNHEYNFVRNMGLSSTDMVTDIKVLRDGKLRPAFHTKSATEYFSEWDAAPEQKQFVLDSSKRMRVDFPNLGLIVADHEIVYAHASLVDMDRIEKDAPDIMWGRLLRNKEKLKANFKAMGEINDFRLFFRGHDHIHSVRHSVDGDYVRYFDEIIGKYKINLEDTRSIVTVGAFVDGRYAIYDSEAQEIDFRRFKVKDRSKLQVFDF